MAVMALLVVVANVVFVTLVLEIGLFFAKLGGRLLTNSSQSPVFGYDRLMALPVTALFMFGQYWYVCGRVRRQSSVQTDVPAGTDLEQRITRLATQASVKPPSVTIVSSSVPNCYTVGRQGNATIVVSRGLLAALDDAELDAVLAHELAHVLNHDVTIMTLAVAPFRLARSLVRALVWGLYAIGFTVYAILYLGVVFVTIVAVLLTVLAGFRAVYDWIVTVIPFIDPGPIVGANIISGVAGVLFGTVMDYVAGFAAVLLTGGLLLIPVVPALSVYYVILGVVPRRLSIYREYAADRGAALLTGNPTAVANALAALTNATDRPTDDFRQATDIQALCLIPDGISDETDAGNTNKSIADDFLLLEAALQRIPTGIVAHPDIEDRIDRLQEIDRNLEEQ
jgi:heat shock protein HtpX